MEQASRSRNETASSGEAFTLPALPYAEDALEPVISARTVGLHYGKHHRGYVDALNKAVVGTPYATMGLPDVIRSTHGKPELNDVYHNAAQAWNHTFYWRSLRKAGGGEPPAALKQRIEEAFGSVGKCRQELLQAATTQFGSGWAWLVQDGDRLAVMKTANGDSPLVAGKKPLLAIDVWEHAYYLDYQNRRPDHVNALLDKLIDWGFVADNLG